MGLFRKKTLSHQGPSQLPPQNGATEIATPATGVPRAYVRGSDPTLPGVAGFHYANLTARNQMPEVRFNYVRPDGFQGEWKARDAPSKYR